MNVNPFKDKPEGRLMAIKENEASRYEFEMWFDYTRQAIGEIREGDLVAIPNFTIPKHGQQHRHVHYTILEITSIMPLHYAMPEDGRGYPGFVMEAAKSASADWRDQEDTAKEDTTKIRCRAIPTNLELIDPALDKSAKGLSIQEDTNIPMLGEAVRLLTPEATEQVVNRGISKDVERVIIGGTLIRNPDISVFLRVEDLLKTHFGIFGFTGAGKSNLVSTLVSRLLGEGKASEGREPIKVVIFDMMGEYTGLLVDYLAPRDVSATVVCLGRNTLPEATFQYLNHSAQSGTPSPQMSLPISSESSSSETNTSSCEKAVRALLDSTLLPKGLKRRKNGFHLAIKALLTRGRIKVWEQSTARMTVEQFIDGKRANLLKGQIGEPTKAAIEDALKSLQQWKDDNLLEAAPQVSQALEEGSSACKNSTAKSRLETFKRDLDKACKEAKEQVELADGVRITTPQIIHDLNNKTHSSLYVVAAHDPGALRDFASTLGYFAYEERRQSGEITPLVSFIFDEADEFVPQDLRDETYRHSSDIAMTLARRGRKFGLGIGIATQRITYLNTSIMAQAHTYFISKLPRKSDRERISEAFGIPEDMFRQTFKFRKGNWLLVSYDATGLDAVPIPIQTENAETRIGRFLDEIAAKVTKTTGGQR